MDPLAQIPIPEPNVPEVFKKHSPIAEKVNAEYHKLFKQLFDDLSPECLEPFAAILLEHENTVLNKDTLIESLRTKMSQVVPRIHEIFFEANDVGNKLITLEVLKEKFNEHVGTNWNVLKLTPEERTRPVRMRLLDSSIRFIQKQLMSQEEAIKVAMAKSKENRDRIQNIQNERVKLYALMQQQSICYQEMTPKLLELTKLLAENKIN